MNQRKQAVHLLMLCALLCTATHSEATFAQDAPDELGSIDDSDTSDSDTSDNDTSNDSKTSDEENATSDEDNATSDEDNATSDEGSATSDEGSATSDEGSATSDEDNATSDDVSLQLAVEVVYSEIAATPVSGASSEMWRFPALRITGLMPLEMDLPIWIGGDVLVGGFFQNFGSSKAGSLFVGPHLRARAVAGIVWKTPIVEVMPYAFTGASVTPAFGTLLVGGVAAPRFQMPLGAEVGTGLWWNMFGFLLRLDLGVGVFDTRLGLSLSGGVGYTF